MRDDAVTTSEFPAGLVKWSGHRGGGVKRLFHEESGRPSGAHVDTPLIHRLRRWVDDLVRPAVAAPTAVLLVGGPGNGKTDAVQVLLEYLDDGLHADGRILAACGHEYSGLDGALAPRMARLKLPDYVREIPQGVPHQLCIVQDASEDPRQPGTSRGRLLAAELLGCLRAPEECLYVCGVNRGVVSEALSAAKLDHALAEAVPLLEELLEAVTSGPKAVSCWPLPSAPRIAAWPMDMESLTAATGRSGPVFRDFIRVAVDETRWPAACAAGTTCPFCSNRRLLATDEASSALCSLLRYFELSAGKRWTFRDLFSLIPHIIVGDDREYITGSGEHDPCAWAAEQSKKGARSSSDALKVKLNLVSRLYQHRLFPLWPTFRSDPYQRALRDIMNVRAPDLAPALGLFSWLGARRKSSDTDVAKLLTTLWSDALDPALVSGAVDLCEADDRPYSVQEVEERFSLSITDGLTLVGGQLSCIEREVLQDLAASDVFLTSPDLPRRYAGSARVIQRVLRQFSCRLAKRSLGTRRGICKGVERLRQYASAAVDVSDLRDFRKSLQALLHDSRNRFTASLVTTFGQPVPYRSRDVRLVASKIPVKMIPRSTLESRPADPIPYVQIGAYVVPVTMELFSSLADRDAGLRAASLPPAVFALFDTTRSIVTGTTARDPAILEDEILVEIGGSREHFHIEAGQITVIAGENGHAS